MNVTLILKIDYCLKPFNIQHSAFNIQHSQNLTETFAASECPNFS